MKSVSYISVNLEGKKKKEGQLWSHSTSMEILSLPFTT